MGGHSNRMIFFFNQTKIHLKILKKNQYNLGAGGRGNVNLEI